MIDFSEYATSEELSSILGRSCYHILCCYYDGLKQKIIYKVELCCTDEDVARNAFAKFYAKMNYILVYRGWDTIYFMYEDKQEWYEKNG